MEERQRKEYHEKLVNFLTEWVTYYAEMQRISVLSNKLTDYRDSFELELKNSFGPNALDLTAKFYIPDFKELVIDKDRVVPAGYEFLKYTGTKNTLVGKSILALRNVRKINTSRNRATTNTAF